MASQFPSARDAAGLGLAAVAAATVAFAPAASAAPPNCTAGDLATVTAGVSAASGAYLFTHPEVNAYLTGLGDLREDEALANLQQYMDANPQIRDELRAIRQPMIDFDNRCGVIPG